jgi:hypothetical protein
MAHSGKDVDWQRVHACGGLRAAGREIGMSHVAISYKFKALSSVDIASWFLSRYVHPSDATGPVQKTKEQSTPPQIKSDEYSLAVKLPQACVAPAKFWAVDKSVKDSAKMLGMSANAFNSQCADLCRTTPDECRSLWTMQVRDEIARAQIKAALNGNAAMLSLCGEQLLGQIKDHARADLVRNAPTSVEVVYPDEYLKEKIERMDKERTKLITRIADLEKTIKQLQSK